ncbi:MAG: penicillin-binding protein 2 [Kiritimatiellae bacterium]|nr:penicillin-binding protein 2 [Kiritimatiellia bacterium]
MDMPRWLDACGRFFARTGVRFAVVALALAGAFAVVTRKLVQVQLHPDPDRIVVPGVVTNVLAATRGGIYDRHGKRHPFAESFPLWKVAVDPLAVPDEKARLAAYRALAGCGAFDRAAVYEALTSTNRTFTGKDGKVRVKRYFPIGETADRAVADLLATNPALSRCTTKERIIRRSYPQGSALCHAVGFVNSIEEPLAGLERTCDPVLRGRPGYVAADASATRRAIASRRRGSRDPVDGNDVILTVDLDLQLAVEAALDEAMTNPVPPRAAWAVVQDCRTGEILAMASRPDFDASDFGSASPDQQRNRAISDVYEPGSVMKTFAAAAALDEGLVTPDTLLDVSPGLYCGRPLRDHTHGHDELTVAQMLAWSSNRGASRLGMMLGKARQQAHLKAFGFGRRTGLPLLGESAGQTVGDGSELNNIRISMGQGMTATAVQLATAYSAIANGGLQMEPHLVKAIAAPDGTVLTNFPPRVVGRPCSERTAEQVAEMLRAVVSREGTARRARVPGYTAAGKTGTAQMVYGGHYSTTDFRGTFVGFFPATDPRLTILVTCEATPKPRTDGGVCAAPVFSRIASDAARILQIPPDDPEAELATR